MAVPNIVDGQFAAGLLVVVAGLICMTGAGILGKVSKTFPARTMTIWTKRLTRWFNQVPMS